VGGCDQFEQTEKYARIEGDDAWDGECIGNVDFLMYDADV